MPSQSLLKVMVWESPSLVTVTERLAPRFVLDVGSAYGVPLPAGLDLRQAMILGTAGFTMQDVLLEPYGGEILGLSVSATTLLTTMWAAGALALANALLGALVLRSVKYRFVYAGLAGLALLVAVLGIGTSPAIALAVVNDSRARGRLSDLTLAIAVVKDLVVVILLAAAVAIGRALLAGDKVGESYVRELLTARAQERLADAQERLGEAEASIDERVDAIMNGEGGPMGEGFGPGGHRGGPRRAGGTHARGGPLAGGDHAADHHRHEHALTTGQAHLHQRETGDDQGQHRHAGNGVGADDGDGARRHRGEQKGQHECDDRAHEGGREKQRFAVQPWAGQIVLCACVEQQCGLGGIVLVLDSPRIGGVLLIAGLAGAMGLILLAGRDEPEDPLGPEVT